MVEEFKHGNIAFCAYELMKKFACYVKLHWLYSVRCPAPLGKMDL